MKKEPVRVSFGILLIMLLMVVGAGLGLLAFLSLQIPAVASELNAWIGRPVAVSDTADARRAKLIFALFTYASPLALGMLVFGLHKVMNLIDKSTRSVAADDDDEFRME